MKPKFLVVLVFASAALTSGQPAAKPASAAKPAAKPAAASVAGTLKLPPGVPPVKAIVKTAFALRYQDIVVGTGADAEPAKMYKVKYTGYRAADGVIFDAWDKHPQPLLSSDGKPVLGEDGKPKMAEPQPASFPVGIGRMIPGFDQGFTGMKVGGKRRIFIPWQLAYGLRDMPGHGPDHPGIPPKSDLIFDVELVDITDLPGPPPGHPAMSMPGHPGMGMVPPHPQAPAASPFPAPAAAPATPPAPAKPTAPAPATPPLSSPQSK